MPIFEYLRKLRIFAHALRLQKLDGGHRLRTVFLHQRQPVRRIPLHSLASLIRLDQNDLRKAAFLLQQRLQLANGSLVRLHARKYLVSIDAPIFDVRWLLRQLAHEGYHHMNIFRHRIPPSQKARPQVSFRQSVCVVENVAEKRVPVCRLRFPHRTAPFVTLYYKPRQRDKECRRLRLQ